MWTEPPQMYMNNENASEMRPSTEGPEYSEA